MRILHMADWHLGRIFYARHLTEDQAYVIEHQLYQLVKEANIDVIVLAGDVFDRAVPPVEAVELWDAVITKFTLDYKVPVLVIGGNHDSAQRLEVGRDVWSQAGLHVWGGLERSLQPLYIEDTYGEIAFCPMPFAEPRTVLTHLLAINSDESQREQWQALPIAYGPIYDAWATYLRSLVKGNVRTVAIAHALVMGSETSESERPLVIGGSASVGVDVFAPFNYAALGHIHRPQRIGADHVRYSGSLLKYSFDEANHKKSFTIVDMDSTGACKLEQIPIEFLHDVVSIKGYFNDILHDEALHKKHVNDYVQVQLLDTAPVIDGMARLRDILPYAMSMELTGRMAIEEKDVDTVAYKHLSERELFEQFAAAVRENPLSETEKKYMDALWDRLLKEADV